MQAFGDLAGDLFEFLGVLFGKLLKLAEELSRLRESRRSGGAARGGSATLSLGAGRVVVDFGDGIRAADTANAFHGRSLRLGKRTGARGAPPLAFRETTTVNGGPRHVLQFWRAFFANIGRRV